MKKTLLLIGIATLAITGCASSGDLTALGDRVNALDSKVSSINLEISRALGVAEQASADASSAKASAESAEQSLAEINAKVDALFLAKMVK